MKQENPDANNCCKASSVYYSMCESRFSHAFQVPRRIRTINHEEGCLPKSFAQPELVLRVDSVEARQLGKVGILTATHHSKVRWEERKE